jgi:putative transcriptional regulator
MHRDGTFHRVMLDGTEVPMPDPGPLALIAEEQISEAGVARSGRAADDRRRISARTHGAPRQDIAAGPRADAGRVAARYHIPLGTVQDWEQGRSEPDQPARAYLTVIGRDPEGVRRALEAKPG